MIQIFSAGRDGTGRDPSEVVQEVLADLKIDLYKEEMLYLCLNNNARIMFVHAQWTNRVKEEYFVNIKHFRIVNCKQLLLVIMSPEE